MSTQPQSNPPAGGAPGMPTPQSPAGPPAAAAGPPPPRAAVPPASAARPRGGRLAAFALLTAGLATVIALVSIMVAVLALSRAGDARRDARAALAGATEGPTGAAPTATGQPAGAPTTDQTQPEATATDGEQLPPINPEANYRQVAQKVSVSMQAISCNEQYLDVDGPAVSNEEHRGSELSITACSGPESFQLLGDVVGSRMDSSAVGPRDCAQATRTSLIAKDALVPVRQGVVLCVLTSFDEADRTGISQKLALLEVTAVSKDGQASIQVTTWDVPR